MTGAAFVVTQGRGTPADFVFIDPYISRFLELWGQTTVTQWTLAFFVLMVTDICWAKYTAATAGTDPFPASCWAVCLFILGGLAVVGYTTNPVLLIPSAIGAFVGTYIGITLSWRKKSDERP